MKNNIEKPNRYIEGKVSGVLNERELTINVGSSQGVNESMKFKILADKPIEVRDPDSGKVLGTVDREKVQVQATEVFEKFSICMTFRKSIVGGNPFEALAISLGGVGSMFSPRREIQETLKAEDSSFPPPLSAEESYVKKGDRVVQIIEVEEK